jgi:predicted transglutaminase-like cysteine proteinase
MQYLALLLALFSLYAIAVPDYKNISEQALTRVEDRFGSEGRIRVSDWKDLLNELAKQVSPEEANSIHSTNDYFNRVDWVWDIDHWGQEDYWATPIETLGSNGGDCEDFSIGKYFSLTNLGMDTSKLRITYVKALEYNLAHMVLAYYETPSSEPLILDNINKTILPASKRLDLLPVYSFNGEGLWLAKSRSRKITGDVSRNLPSWGGLKNKIDAELQ